MSMDDFKTIGKYILLDHSRCEKKKLLKPKRMVETNVVKFEFMINKFSVEKFQGGIRTNRTVWYPQAIE